VNTPHGVAQRPGGAQPVRGAQVVARLADALARDIFEDQVGPGPARAAQLARLRGWTAPGWEEHFAAVDGLLEEVARRSARLPATPARRPGSAAPRAQDRLRAGEVGVR
jgi:hypothetical protein